MPMSAPPTYPFVDDFLEAKWGTLYLLSDAQARIRDAHAVLTLTRFFAGKGVDLDVSASRWLIVLSLKR